MYNYFLENLTILIFSYNRHRYLKRTIKYWSKYNAKVVVIDGGDTKLEDECLGKKNIKYVYDPRNLYDRLKSSSSYIDTEFMILGCDDEFYLPSALSSCIKFLTNNTDYSCCGGRVIGFSTNNNELFGREVYPELKNFSLTNDCAFQRVEKHMSNYTIAHIYSVTRSNNWKKICKHVFEKEYNLYAAFELQIEFLMPVFGKSKIIPELMTMRNLDVEPIRGTSPSLNPKSSGRLKWWFDNNMGNERKNFFYRMNKACQEILMSQNYRFNEIAVAKLIKVFFDKIYLKKNNLIKRVMMKILKFLPNQITLLLKIFSKKIKILNKIEKKNTQSNLIKQINSIKSENVLVNQKDIDNIVYILKVNGN
jgi:glycosyltransferase domain-containing protein